MAACGVSAALCVTLMALGSLLGVMTYVCPILAGLVVGYIRVEFGTRDALTLWAAVSCLSVLLVSEVEMSALFIGLFGWYPAARPALERLPRWGRWMGKCAAYLGSVLLVYGGLFLVMGLDGLDLGPWWAAGLLLALLGLVFFCYDRALGRLTPGLARGLAHLLRRR
jgi:hypothetical protein